MASGFLGKANPAAATWTLLYTVPSTKLASVSVNAVNTAATPTNIDIAVSSSATSAGIVLSEYMEYAVPLASTGSALERTGIVTSQTSNPYVWVRSSSANTVFQIYGYEE